MALREAQLTAAFHDFNRLSTALESSYRDLENQVAQLSGELARTRRERMRELEERDRLAGRLEQLLALLPGGVLVIDGEGRIRTANPAAASLLGEPLLGAPLASVLARLKGDDWSSGAEASTADGRRLAITRRALGTEPGEIALVTDVTEAVRMREWLERNRRLSTLGQMAASLAHQVRTPLAAALLYANRLNTPSVSDAQRHELAEKVASRLRHLESQVADMLAFARGGGSRLVRCDVNALLESVAQSLAARLTGRARLTIRTFAPNLAVNANPEALVGALVNLTTNALEAAGASAEVEIEAMLEDGLARIRVRDNGPGVPAAVADRIFEPFFTTRPSGTGLGLAVVRSVATAHGGRACLEPAPRGACFLLELPALTEP